MWHDTLTVFWKEIIVLRRAHHKPSLFLSTGLHALFFGMIPALLLGHSFFTSPLTLFYLALAPLITGSGMAALSFASEREENTLETLFASRLDELPILLGKIAANALYAWLYVLLCILAGWITVSLVVGRIVAYNLEILVGGLLIGFSVALFSATIGAMASLRAGTVQEAGRNLQAIYLALVLPYISLIFVSQRSHTDFLTNVGSTYNWLILTGSVVILIVIDVCLLFLTARRFRRSQMPLD